MNFFFPNNCLNPPPLHLSANFYPLAINLEKKIIYFARQTNLPNSFKHGL